MLAALLVFTSLTESTSTGTIQEIPIFAPNVAPNGLLVVGMSMGPLAGPFIWTATGGARPLDLGLDGAPGMATAASADGKAIVGWVKRNDAYWVFLWREGEAVTFICQNGTNGSPGVSGGGKSVFGQAGTGTSEGFKESPFLWSATKGVRRLQPLSQGKKYGGAVASSFDGTIFAGYCDVGPKDPEFRKTHFGTLYIEDGSTEGAVWFGEVRPIGLGRPDGFFTSQVTDCSREGTMFCGFGATKQGDKPFTWSMREGMKLLPMPSGTESAEAYFISSDGKTVFGSSGQTSTALVWRDDFGVLTLAEFLRKYGLDTKEWSLGSITGVSDDGRVIAGGGKNPDGKSCYWIVTLTK